MDGGFSTYAQESNLITKLDDKHITDVTGWLYNHNCVTAVSFYFLANLNVESQSYKDIKQYFEDNLRGKLNSYWWTDPIYTYYYLAKTYHLINDNQKLDFIIKELKKKQNSNGSFSDSYGENFFLYGVSFRNFITGQ